MSETDLPESPKECRRCDLWRHATQAVLGNGDRHAHLMLVGEQPGDEEDRCGQPFVGPSGRLLDEVLAEIGVAREALYVTNAVKHFKWEPRGKWRLHKRPSVTEIRACNIWLAQEITKVKPTVIVALGATALQALMGRAMTIDRARRSKLQHPAGATLIATYHPAALLRNRDDRLAQLRAAFAEDLRRAALRAGLNTHASSAVRTG